MSRIPNTPAGDDAARAEMARLLLEGARRLLREREAAETAPQPLPPQKPTFTEDELRRRPRYRPANRKQRADDGR